ncbi:hypothetical protein BD626DRAFT_541035 [Schizophyllum amplum]|uniref:Uncharacterized protein n=1 Tax=Schizophyllum amplum TaxID=97359 RepID=A0A550BW44_9AGAR|nr:hypothetical protein BD626DRAFT_541035 [Auriculariopsis ampla]
MRGETDAAPRTRVRAAEARWVRNAAISRGNVRLTENLMDPSLVNNVSSASVSFDRRGCSTMSDQADGRLEGHPLAVAFYSNADWRETRSGMIETLQVLAKDVIAQLHSLTWSLPLGSPSTHPTIEGTRVIFYITPQFLPELDIAAQVRVLNLLQSFAETTGVKAPVHFNSIKRMAFDWRDKRERRNSVESPESVAARATRVLSDTIRKIARTSIIRTPSATAQDPQERAGRAEAAALASAGEVETRRRRVADLEAETQYLHSQCTDNDFLINVWREDYISQNLGSIVPHLMRVYLEVEVDGWRDVFASWGISRYQLDELWAHALHDARHLSDRVGYY